ncbi:hypothetical protein E2C01_051160 [Portunus trituberculatus]|uniref:Uncharacterized protein n=1 Tax=Portunus trituberculatus TaxID=210409 RepID=A0A5B7GHV6_PORTR|nr:hypothetical protein [Portunus trituberculatus]
MGRLICTLKNSRPLNKTTLRRRHDLRRVAPHAAATRERHANISEVITSQSYYNDPRTDDNIPDKTHQLHLHRRLATTISTTITTVVVAEKR